MVAPMERESMVMAPPPTRDSAVLPCFHGCPAFLHRHFPPQSPPLHTLNLSLSSQQQPLALGLLHNPWTPAPSRCTFQGIYVPVWSMYGCSKDCIPFRLPQISCFTLSLKCFSSDSVAQMWGSDPCFSSPTLQGGVPVLLTLLFFSLVPSSYRVLCGSIYLFPLVRYSCLLSAGVLYALLCLKVYSWCIQGERYTPRPPTSPPSCSPGCLLSFWLDFLFVFLLLSCMCYLYSLEIKPSLVISFANIFSPSVDCLHFVDGFLLFAKVFKYN